MPHLRGKRSSWGATWRRPRRRVCEPRRPVAEEVREQLLGSTLW